MYSNACEEDAVYTKGFSLPFLPYHLNSQEKKNAPYQHKFLRCGQSRATTEGKMQNEKSLSDATTETSLNFKAQSHTLI